MAIQRASRTLLILVAVTYSSTSENTKFLGCYKISNTLPVSFNYFKASSTEECNHLCSDDGYPFALHMADRCGCALKFKSDEHEAVPAGSSVKDMNCIYKTNNPTSGEMMNYIKQLEKTVSGNANLPAFTALTSGNPAIIPGQPLIFDKVLTNRAEAYNPSTGYFSCPSNGLYIFMVHLESNKGEHANVYIVKNNQTLVRAAGWPVDDFHSGSNSVITSCQQGEKVYVEGISQGHVSCCLTSSFSGFYITE